ncbi:MAG: zf-HC2 domain-containing protein [Polyangiaceae bacterium]|nr:zf-HC2 domain-containing protein [Polyangiaceae bacterium]
MNRAERATPCQLFEPWLSAHVDGELDAVHASELDGHLGDCVRCREELALLRAMRTSLRRTAAPRAPQALRERVMAALQAERRPDEACEAVPAEVRASLPGRPSARGAEVVPRDDTRAPRIRLRFAVPLAAAATFALVFAAVRSGDDGGAEARDGATVTPTALAATEQASLENLLDDLVTQHADPLPPETTDPNGLERFNPLVGVRVKRPEFQPYGARYVGARVQAMRERRAAMLQYVVNDRHRVTMYVFDPRRVPVVAAAPQPRLLHRRAVGARPVYVGHIRGFAVAASENDGIGYALASDLSDDESAQLVTVAAR